MRPPDLGRPVFDLLELEEQLEGVAAGPTAIFPAVIGEHCTDARFMRLEVGSTSLFMTWIAVTGSLLG